MLRLKVAGEKSGRMLLPVFYSDNYFSLLPGEVKEVDIRLYDADNILQNQPTNSYTKYCELVGFFVSLGIPPKIRFDGQNGGNIQTNKIWQR